MTRIRALTITAALLLVLIAALLLVLTRRDGDASTPAGIPSPAATSTNPAPTTSADPYETYLKLAPKGSLHLSREDAQTRAYLGCGQTWAPGTVDAALAVAYKDLCKRGG